MSAARLQRGDALIEAILDRTRCPCCDGVTDLDHNEPTPDARFVFRRTCSDCREFGVELCVDHDHGLLILAALRERHHTRSSRRPQHT